MRKAAVLTLLLLALTVSGAAYLAAEVYATRDDIAVTPTHHYGDPSVLQDAAVTLRATYDNQLFWDVAYPLGRSPSTTYRFTPTREYIREERVYEGLWMDSAPSFSYDTTGEIPLDGLTGFDAACRDFAATVPAGAERTTTVRLADYMDYYELTLSVDLPTANIQHNGPGDYGDLLPYEKEVVDAIRDFFKIPVLEEEYYELTVGKNFDGQVNHLGGGTTGSDNYYISTITAVSSDACYLSVCNRSTQGQLMDMSHIPGGYGIYRLPYGPDAADETGAIRSGVRAEELSMVYPLDPEAWVLSLMLNEEETELLIFSQEEGMYVLTVVDLATMERRQRIPLCAYTDEHWGGSDVRRGDGFFLVRISAPEREEELLLVTEGEEGYTLSLHLPVETEHIPFYEKMSNYTMAYNGDKLLLTGPLLETEQPYWDDTCDFYVLVYDDTGLLYSGAYASSITTREEFADYNYPVRPISVEAAWAG